MNHKDFARYIVKYLFSNIVYYSYLSSDGEEGFPGKDELTQLIN